MFADFPVSIVKLRQKFCSASDCFFIRGEQSIDHIFSELYNVPQNIKRHYLVIKILELVLYLGGLETENGNAQRPYFYKSQTKRIKEIHALLSGGEKQRISIARAILKNAPIIILDEATASIDPENEHLIQAAISELTQGKTIITIAHRLATIQNADRILVVDGGTIAQQGTHAELLAQEGIYKRFIEIREKAEGWSIG